MSAGLSGKIALVRWLEKLSGLFGSPKMPGQREMLLEQAERNIKRIRFGQRFNRNHPLANHSHARENTRRMSQMRPWWTVLASPVRTHAPINDDTMAHSGTIVLDAGTTNVYQGV